MVASGGWQLKGIDWAADRGLQDNDLSVEQLSNAFVVDGVVRIVQ